MSYVRGREKMEGRIRGRRGRVKEHERVRNETWIRKGRKEVIAGDEIVREGRFKVMCVISEFSVPGELDKPKMRSRVLGRRGM